MRRIYRSRQNRILGGVAAGAADYFDIDVTVVRLVMALAAVFVHEVVAAYILAWVIIPEASQGAEHYRNPPVTQIADTDGAQDPSAGPAPIRHGGSGRQVLGYALIVVGVCILARRLVPQLFRIPFHLLRNWWPITIIGLGLILVFGALRSR